MRNYGGSHKRFGFLLRSDFGVVVYLFSLQVFRCVGLDAIQGLREDELIGPLTKVFQEQEGRDLVRLVWGHQGQVDLFAGVSLKENWISVVESNPISEKKRHLRKPSRDQHTRELNAAHILTAFWKLNGPRFLKQMKEHRRYFASQYKYPPNCYLLLDMGGDSNLVY